MAWQNHNIIAYKMIREQSAMQQDNTKKTLLHSKLIAHMSWLNKIMNFCFPLMAK